MLGGIKCIRVMQGHTGGTMFCWPITVRVLFCMCRRVFVIFAELSIIITQQSFSGASDFTFWLAWFGCSGAYMTAILAGMMLSLKIKADF